MPLLLIKLKERNKERMYQEKSIKLPRLKLYERKNGKTSFCNLLLLSTASIACEILLPLSFSLKVAYNPEDSPVFYMRRFRVGSDP
jgi:hypothetical protein